MPAYRLFTPALFGQQHTSSISNFSAAAQSAISSRDSSGSGAVSSPSFISFSLSPVVYLYAIFTQAEFFELWAIASVISKLLTPSAKVG